MTECAFYDVPCFLGWLLVEMKLFFVWILEGVLGAGASVLEAIPVPDFMVTMGSINLPPMIAYLSDVFMLPEGAAIQVTALTLRFLIRRIPIIG
jgi:hypothetical protein